MACRVWALDSASTGAEPGVGMAASPASLCRAGVFGSRGPIISRLGWYQLTPELVGKLKVEAESWPQWLSLGRAL